MPSDPIKIKFVTDLIAKCHSTSNNAVQFASTRLLGHARLFPTKIAMRTVELSVGILTALDRLDRIEEDLATKTPSTDPTDPTNLTDPTNPTNPTNPTTAADVRHSALEVAYNALDLVDRFINVFRPVTRLEYFAEEQLLEEGWTNALTHIEDAKQRLVDVLRGAGDQIEGSGSWDVLEAEEGGGSQTRMKHCFSSLEEATKHVWGDLEYSTNIEYDVERKRNSKIKTLLDNIRTISAADKKADTSQSIEQMLDATSVFDGFVRQFALGSIMDKLAKKTKSTRNEIGDTIKGHWETLGFDMDDDRAFEMIELFLENNNKDQDTEGDGPSLDVVTRPSLFAHVCFLGSVEENPDLVRVTKQTSRSPEPLDAVLYPNRVVELPGESVFSVCCAVFYIVCVVDCCNL